MEKHETKLLGDVRQLTELGESAVGTVRQFEKDCRAGKHEKSKEHLVTITLKLTPFSLRRKVFGVTVQSRTVMLRHITS